MTEIFPIGEAPEQSSLVPLFPEESMPTIPGNVEEVSTQAALVEMTHSGKSFDDQYQQTFNNLQTLGIDEVRRSISQQEKNVDLKVAENQVKLNLNEDTAAYYENILVKHRGPEQKQALEQAVVDIITPTNKIAYYNEFNRKENAKDLAARNILYTTINETGQNSSFWDHVLLIGRSMVPFLNSRGISSAAAEALDKKTTFKDIFNPNQIIAEFRNAYIMAPAEHKKEMIQALVHGLERTSSLFGDKNAAVVAMNLTSFISGRESEQDINTLFDITGLPLVTTARLLTKSARVVSELGKPANIAIHSGNAGLATDLLTQDALKKSTISGMSQDEIARLATSMNMTPMELSFTDLKVAQPLQDKLREVAAGLRSGVSDTLMPSSVTPTQIVRGAEYYEDLYSTVRNRAVYEYSPTGYNEGVFTGEIKWQTPEGVPFLTKEAAEEFGKDLGKTGEAIQVNKPITPILDAHYPGVAEDNEWIFKESINNPLPLESIGTYTLQDVSSRNWWNFGIPTLAGSIETVTQRGLGRSAQANIARQFEKEYKASIKFLSAKESKLVNQALIDGDALSNQAGAFGHVFNTLELSARGLNEKGIESYYRQRILRDSMLLFRNKQAVQEFKAGGYKELAFEGNAFVGPLNTPARPMELGTIKSLNTQGKVGKVLNTVDGLTINLTSENLDKLYEGGGRVVKLYKPQVIGGRRYSHIIVDSQTTFKDITMPIPYRPGEFSRGYTDEYFITLKRNVPDEFDRMPGMAGYEGETTRTVRTAHSEAEATKFTIATNKAIKVAFDNALSDGAKLQQLERVIGKYMNPSAFLQDTKTGKISKDEIFDFHYNRETHSYLQDTVDEGLTNGRMFYSKRGEKLLSVDSSRVNTLDVHQSLGIELANISRFITSKDIRVDAIEKWINTFGDGLVNPSHNKMSDFTHQPLDASKIKEALLAKGSSLSQLESSELLKFAEAERKYIKDQLNIRTQKQKTNAESYRKTTEWIEGATRKVSPGTADWFGPTMRKTNVSDFLRKVNFIISLAAGNVSQLIVQANGMAISVARHPIHGLAAAKMAISLRLALMSDNPNVWKTMGTIDSLTSFGLTNINEFVDVVQAIKKSGILSDIKSTALFNVEDGALDLYKGYAKEFISEASPFFFNRGEEFSRLVSWEVARREWKGKHPGEAWNSNNALREISARQKEYNLGMQAHNTAQWQKGWSGVPMQFLQYNVKLTAALGHTTSQFFKNVDKKGWKALTNFDDGEYRQFNPAEALSILGTQLVFYGVAGNGLHSIANNVWGDESGMSEEQKMYISEGLAGGLIYTLTKEMDGEGAKLAVGKRLGSFEWYDQIFDKITSDKTSMSDFLLGATKSNGVKVFDQVRNLARLFYYEEARTPEVILDTFKQFPEIFASYSNALKAYTYMQNENIVTSKDGNATAKINTKENLAAFIGISSVQIQEYYETVKDQQHLYGVLNDLAKEVHKIQIRRWDAVTAGDQKLADDLENLQWRMLPTDMAQRTYVMKQLRTKLWPGDTATDKIRRQFGEKMNQSVEEFRVLDKN